MKTPAPRCSALQNMTALWVAGAIGAWASTATAGPSTITVGDASVVTGSAVTTIQFPLSRTGDLGYDVVLEYRTVDGTAIGGVDFTPAPAGSNVLLPAGQAVVILPITVAANQPGGPPRTFSLVLDRAWGTGPEPRFAATGDLAAGPGTADVAFGDLDLSGGLDLVSVHSGSNTLSVRAGATPPGASAFSFGPPLTYTVGNAPTSVIVVDLDGDGRAEIVAANNGSQSVSVLRNQTAPGGTLSFTVQGQRATGVGAQWIRHADLNNDGRPDLIVAGDPSPTNALAVLLNTTNIAAGTGPEFSAAQGFGGNFTATGLALADIDGDGRIDVLVNGPGGVRVFRNTTTPGASTVTFATPVLVAGSGPGAGLGIGDVDGDGRPDLVRTSGLGSVTVLRNTSIGPGSISFGAPIAFDVGFDDYDLAVTDLNGDGRPDIVLTRFSGNELRVLRNLTRPGGTPKFQLLPAIAVPGRPIGLELGDLNGDGIPDLAVSQSETGTIALFRGARDTDTATVSFAAPTVAAVNENPQRLAVADFDLDGRPDLLAANFTTIVAPSGQWVSALRNVTAPGAATVAFDPFVTLPVQIGITFPAWPYDVLALDVNMDGRPDVVSANYGQRAVAVRTNAITSPGSFSNASFNSVVGFDTGNPGLPTGLASGDLNGDGRPDVVANLFFQPADGPNSLAFVMLNSTTPGGTPSFERSTPANLGTSRPENAVVLADINRDGRLDIVATNFLDQTVRTFFNATPIGSVSAPSFPATGLVSIDGRPRSVAAGDLNGDGRVDIVTATQIGSTSTGSVAVLMNETAPGASAAVYTRTEIPINFLATGTQLADVDGDGRLDVLALDIFNNRILVLLNRTAPGASTAAFEVLPPFTINPTARGFQVADLNGDGQPDIAVGHGTTQGSIAVYLNTRLAATASGSANGILFSVDEIFADSFE